MAMCGPSAAEKDIAGSSQSLAQTLAANFQSRFQSQDQLLQNLNHSLTPIVAAGPEQQGFSAEELAAKNTQAINSAAAANRNAQQVVGSTLAGRGGGGDSGLISGVDRAIKAGISTSAANELANAQNTITQQNYDVGRGNYKTALAGAQALSGEYNPEGFAREAQTGFESSFGMANKVNSESQAAGKAIAGGLSSLAKTGLSFATGGVSNLLAGGAEAGSETGGGIEQFFSGGLNALGG